MGNRAVITASKMNDAASSDDIGVYLHWNGGRDSVEAFLTYCNMRGFRAPDYDNYGWARLCQVVANYFGKEGLSIGIDRCCNLDCRGDNGVYIIKGWEIIGRQNFNSSEQQNYALKDMLLDIDNEQPEEQRLGTAAIEEYCDALAKSKLKLLRGGGDVSDDETFSDDS